MPTGATRPCPCSSAPATRPRRRRPLAADPRQMSGMPTADETQPDGSRAPCVRPGSDAASPCHLATGQDGWRASRDDWSARWSSDKSCRLRRRSSDARFAPQRHRSLDRRVGAARLTGWADPCHPAGHATEYVAVNGTSTRRTSAQRSGGRCEPERRRRGMDPGASGPNGIRPVGSGAERQRYRAAPIARVSTRRRRSR